MSDSTSEEKSKLKPARKLKPLEKFMLKVEELSEEQKKQEVDSYKGPFSVIKVPRFIVSDVEKNKKSNLYVITVAKRLLKYIVQITEKSPKKFRFTFVSRMQNYAIDILENLYKANQYRSDISKTVEFRTSHQRDAYTQLKLLSYIAFLACENLCILKNQYILIAEQVNECMNYLVVWMDENKKGLTTARC